MNFISAGAGRTCGGARAQVAGGRRLAADTLAAR